MNDVDDYIKYRGKCKETCEDLVKHDSTLILVRGYYHCPFEGKRAHWWCKKQDGTIIDPTVRQFQSKGVCAEYEEFDGWLNCEECNKRIHEEKTLFAGTHPVCSYKCYARLVGCD